MSALYSDEEFIGALVSLGAVDRDQAETAAERIEREASVREVADEIGCSGSAARARLKQLAEKGLIESRTIASNTSRWWIEQ